MTLFRSFLEIFVDSLFDKGAEEDLGALEYSRNLREVWHRAIRSKPEAARKRSGISKKIMQAMMKKRAEMEAKNKAAAAAGPETQETGVTEDVKREKSLNLHLKRPLTSWEKLLQILSYLQDQDKQTDDPTKQKSKEEDDKKKCKASSRFNNMNNVNDALKMKDVEDTFLPFLTEKYLRKFYDEKFRSIPIVEAPDAVTQLFQCKRMMEELTKLRKPIDDEFRHLINLAKVKADWDIREWYQNAVEEYGLYMEAYLDIMMYLLECKQWKYKRELEKFAADRWQSVIQQAFHMLHDEMQQMDLRKEKQEKIAENVVFNENHEKLTCDSAMYYRKCIEQFNKLQQNKLKTSLRAMTLFEIEHNQQIVEHARIEFSRFDKIGAKCLGEALKHVNQVKKRAEMISENLENQMAFNRNLHERLTVSKSSSQELIKQMTNLLNYFIEFKQIDVPVLKPFDKCQFLEILGKKPARSVLQYRKHCPKDENIVSYLIAALDSQTKFNADGKVNITEESEIDDPLKDEGSEPLTAVEEVISCIIRRMIPTPPDRSSLLSDSEAQDSQRDQFEEDELLAQDAFDQRREKETMFCFDGEDLEVPPSDLKPKEFVAERVAVIHDIIRRNKDILGTLFD